MNSFLLTARTIDWQARSPRGSRRRRRVCESAHGLSRSASVPLHCEATAFNSVAFKKGFLPTISHLIAIDDPPQIRLHLLAVRAMNVTKGLMTSSRAPICRVGFRSRKSLKAKPKFPRELAYFFSALVVYFYSRPWYQYLPAWICVLNRQRIPIIGQIPEAVSGQSRGLIRLSSTSTCYEWPTSRRMGFRNACIISVQLTINGGRRRASVPFSDIPLRK